MEDLSCKELVELVTEYFDGALTPGDRARFEAHLDECTGCARYVEQMRMAIAVTGATAELGKRPEIAGLLEAFRGSRRSR